MTPLVLPLPARALLLPGGTWTSVSGARCGVACGSIKPTTTTPDVVVLEADGVAAAVITRSTAAAPPCTWSRARVPGPVRAVVVNSGNANAATGAPGMADVAATAAAVAEVLGCTTDAVLVCSTGVIGVPLPMDRLLPAAAAAAADLTAPGDAAARAIMTTDLVAKQAACTVGAVTVSGIAKGSGMIHPDMATMLGFLATDATVAASDLQALLTAAVDRSFNAVTVDGDMSTNDTVTLHATGRGPAIAPGQPGWSDLVAALDAVCVHLARAIARDGEGAEHLLTVCVEGLADDRAARQAARAVARSPLVKSAVHGGDPNWGRVVGALGAHGVLGLESLDLDFGGVPVLRGGTPVAGWDEAAAAAAMRAEEVIVHARLPGPGLSFAWGCDLTDGYVRINADYRS
jgi:glutamate N-acetyltransferase/amino-acid N-acetyltransferase